MTREEEIFQLALDLTPGDRPAFVADACGGDEVLRLRVMQLLDVPQTDAFLAFPATRRMSDELSRRGDWRGEQPGDLVGPYKLLEVIGDGGFGTVWMAEQTEPLRRRVALKIIKPGMDSKEVVARFEQERQALALMEHPNIAKVFDAGLGASGRPFFVMELVRGVPITTYCDDARLSVPERLRLFVQVCRAIQHAHQKGVIHRDIKPSNVLVAADDGGEPLPKVIDFGIARALEKPLTDKTLFTRLNEVIGTPAYMSPEQAGAGPMDIDTRTDVYALGVLLYEMLTGCPPFDPGVLLQAGWEEMRRLICEEEPAKPSTNLTGMQPARLTTVARCRRTDAPHLVSDIRGDLDWIAMKAMDKNRSRRYETANGLAEDVLRYLQQEPVLARPPSLRYRVGKFVLKHRVVVAATALVFAALFAGLAVSTVQYLRARTALARESVQRTRAIASEQTARTEAARAEANEKDATREAARAVANEERAKAAAARAIASEESAKEATAQAQANEKIARKALESESVQRTRAMASEQTALTEAARAEANEKAATREAARAVASEESARAEAVKNKQTAKFLAQLLSGVSPAQAKGRDVTLLREILDQASERLSKELKDQPAVEAYLRSTIGATYQALGLYSNAVTHFEQSLEINRRVLGSMHPETLAAMNSLGLALKDHGQYDAAESLLKETVEAMKETFGKEDERTLSAMSNLATVQGTSVFPIDRSGAVVRQLGEVLTVQERGQGIENPGTLATANNLAATLRRQGYPGRAVEFLRDYLVIQKRVMGSDHPDTLAMMSNYALACFEAAPHSERPAKMYEESTNILEEVLAVELRVLGPRHPDTLTTRSNLACILDKQGSHDAAEIMMLQVLEDQKAALGPRHPATIDTMKVLAHFYSENGKRTEEEAAYRWIIEAGKMQDGQAAPEACRAKYQLAELCANEGRHAEAAELLRESWKADFESDSKLSPVDFRHKFFSNVNLAEAWLKRGHCVEAEAMSRICVEQGKEHMPDAWTCAFAESVLGGTLLEQGKFDEARPLLLSGYEGMRLKEGKLQPWDFFKTFCRNSIERLVRLSEATGDVAGLDGWSSKLDQFDQAWPSDDRQ